ncbi:unnamed protein product [Phytomonas sp. Hart1]|nr:unnamed protein product [Phytomonas sp. Hart1]|eukprot:CCW67654.1 unnamed protein product [Phytomonas sp. isolate Hart1]
METLRRRNPILSEKNESTNTALLNHVAKVDLFRKPKEDFKRSQTYLGGCISAFTFSVIILFILWEAFSYISGRNSYFTTLTLDDNANRSMDVYIDILFPSLQCYRISIDTLDVSGSIRFNIERNLYKIPVTSNGILTYRGDLPFRTEESNLNYDPSNHPELANYCLPCFLPEDRSKIEKMSKNDASFNPSMCCNTCEDVQRMYANTGLDLPSLRVIPQCISELSTNEPGCNIVGSINMKKIPGFLVFLPTHAGYRFNVSNLLAFNTSHVIKKIVIGDRNVRRFSRTGVSYPLNGERYTTPTFSEVKYFLKVVPTTYNTKEKQNSSQRTYEYSAQMNDRKFSIVSSVIPAVIFGFDISPFQINNYFLRPPLLRFLIKLCGIVGGVFVVLSIVDSVIDYFARLVFKNS